jgi:hypothetical protein
MPPKKQLSKTADADPLALEDAHSDEELEMELRPTTVSAPQAPDQLEAVQPSLAVPAKKAKRPYTLTEEHKEALRERIQVAHERRRELAEVRRREREKVAQELEMKKQAKILQEAEKIRRREEKMLKNLEVNLPLPPAPKKKKKVVVYVSDSEDEEEEEEEEEVRKRGRAPQATRQATRQAPPVYQPINWKIV